jgi:hypothetical protein
MRLIRNHIIKQLMTFDEADKESYNKTINDF